MRTSLFIGGVLIAAAACFMPAAYAQAPAPENDAPAAEPSLLLEKPEYRKVKSIFFTQEETNDIRLALNTYRKHFSGGAEDAAFDEEDFLNQLAGMRKSPKTNRYFVYPQFFLESLVYHGKDNWSVWVNGMKVTFGAPQDNSDIRVVAIDQNQASFEWKPVAMERVNEVWSRMPNNDVKVDRKQGVVSFSLRPNQTFSSYVMRVLEGKVKPVTVDNTVAGITEDGEEASPPPEPVSPPAAANGNRQGIGGLINAYSNIQTDGGVPAPVPTVAQEKKP